MFPSTSLAICEPTSPRLLRWLKGRCRLIRSPRFYPMPRQRSRHIKATVFLLVVSSDCCQRVLWPSRNTRANCGSTDFQPLHRRLPSILPLTEATSISILFQHSRLKSRPRSPDTAAGCFRSIAFAYFPKKPLHYWHCDMAIFRSMHSSRLMSRWPHSLPITAAIFRSTA